MRYSVMNDPLPGFPARNPARWREGVARFGAETGALTRNRTSRWADAHPTPWGGQDRGPSGRPPARGGGAAAAQGRGGGARRPGRPPGAPRAAPPAPMLEPVADLLA